jgi:homoserine kinase
MSDSSDKTLTVKVPGSTANLGPGFDVLGMSISLYCTVSVSPSDELSIDYDGRNSTDIPLDDSNQVYRAIQAVFAREGHTIPPMYITINNEIPLRGGLGSSEAATVAGMRLGREMTGAGFTDQALFSMAIDMEGHPDNISASLFGGLTVSIPTINGYLCQSLVVPDPPSAIVLLPHTEVSTCRARELLPESIAFKDMIVNLSGVASLLAGLTSSPRRLQPDFFIDRVHQPYRSQLMPWMFEVIDSATTAGAEGCFLSGAGPSIIALCSLDRTSVVREAMENVMKRNSMTFECLMPQVAVPIESSLPHSPKVGF